MIPPPMTSSLPGMSSGASAAVESMTRGSSGIPGIVAGSEPAATTQFSKVISRPGARGEVPATCSVWGPVKRASPRTTSTRRWVARLSRPLVSRSTTDAFQPISLPTSIVGAPKLIPWAAISSASAITRAACNSALEGMQPTLRHTPPRRSERSTRIVFRPRSAARKAAV